MHRFMLDNDGAQHLIVTMHRNVETLLRDAVRECPAAVTTYLLCGNGCGMMFYPTTVGKPWCKKESGYSLMEAWDAGLDPFGMFLRLLKEAGKETFITYRVNDVHGVSDPNHPGSANPFRLKYPDAIVNPAALQQKSQDWLDYCLDYARPEVRAYNLALIGEMIERYGDTIDGVQLDWLRFPRNLSGTPEEVWEKRGCLTEFMLGVKELIRRSGRPLTLAVRVPTSPAGCRRLGLDLPEWTRRSLVDFATLAAFLTTDFTLPVAEMRQWVGAHALPLYGNIEMNHLPQAHHPESLRAAASGLYVSGVDGLYIFNFPCWTGEGMLGACPYNWLDDLASSEAAARKPLLFAATTSHCRVGGVDLPGQLSLPLPVGGEATLELQLPDVALDGVWRARALVQAGGDVALSVNGHPAEEWTGVRRAELFVEYLGEGGWSNNRPKPDDCRLFFVDPAVLRAGANQFVLTNLTALDLEIQRFNLGLW